MGALFTFDPRFRSSIPTDAGTSTQKVGTYLPGAVRSGRFFQLGGHTPNFNWESLTASSCVRYIASPGQSFDDARLPPFIFSEEEGRPGTANCICRTAPENRNPQKATGYAAAHLTCLVRMDAVALSLCSLNLLPDRSYFPAFNPSNRRLQTVSLGDIMTHSKEL